ncbi:MAG: 2Fe-2S iron-sulfur cluster binding domain-containing protein, partial [Acetobacteraceae bacterium]|nr:2Fe-2S iron-sulfur cluster binding domain-containing protein [Acetobacteraceae bacterium]
MAWTVRVAHSDLSFPCGAEESVLEAAQRAGFDIPYSCRRGVCLTCQGKVVAGSVAEGGSVRSAAPCQPLEALLCSARPRSDLTVSPRRVSRLPAAGQPREVEARVFRKREIAPGVVALHLRFAIGVRVAFRTGQS